MTFSPRITVDPYFGANYTVKWTNLRSNNTKLSTGEQLVIENAVIFKDDGNYEVRVATAQDEARVSKTLFYEQDAFCVNTQIKVVKNVKLVLQDVPQPPMDTELENTDSGVLVKFTPGFDNYAPISEYKVGRLVCH